MPPRCAPLGFGQCRHGPARGAHPLSRRNYVVVLENHPRWLGETVLDVVVAKTSLQFVDKPNNPTSFRISPECLASWSYLLFPLFRLFLHVRRTLSFLPSAGPVYTPASGQVVTAGTTFLIAVHNLLCCFWRVSGISRLTRLSPCPSEVKFQQCPCWLWPATLQILETIPGMLTSYPTRELWYRNIRCWYRLHRHVQWYIRDSGANLRSNICIKYFNSWF